MRIPEEAIAQHTAILGKTGSGKSSTAKLIIEQVVAAGARVCILDPIKSDWWGLTVSADGKRPGLPFDILGGPHGHVPVHAAAGKAIAGVVASGALPLSIIDMADFAPGGQMQFFVDFAPELMKKMKGVIYLVIEEAHLYAPKERSGVGAENMAIHWAKMLATAGRSKGVRLILITQRTQALHNALLGSCDTLIAHRFTAPADQEPVIKWLKANVTKDILEKVAGSLSSLKTGDGWLCAGEEKIFELIHFPRIKTYDNTATPTNDDHRPEVKTAAVDQDKLRSIIGEAVKAAEDADPKVLRDKVARLEKALAAAQAKADEPAVSNQDMMDDLKEAHVAGFTECAMSLNSFIAACRYSLLRMQQHVDDINNGTIRPNPEPLVSVERTEKKVIYTSHSPYERPLPPTARPIKAFTDAQMNAGSSLSKAERLILTALAQYPDGRSKNQVAAITGYAVNGGGFNNAVSALRSAGRLDGSTERLRITEGGLTDLGSFNPLPTGDALLQHWLNKLGKAERSILSVLASAYPKTKSKEDVAASAGYASNGGGFNNALSYLRTMELISGRGELQASSDLFQ